MGALVAAVLKIIMSRALVGGVVTSLAVNEIVDIAYDLLGGPDTPEKDQLALDAGRTVAHILDDPDCLHPVARRGANKGEPIVPTHLVYDLVGKRCWFTSSYKTKGTVDAAFGRGRRSGIKQGTADAQRAVIAAS